MARRREEVEAFAAALKRVQGIGRVYLTGGRLFYHEYGFCTNEDGSRAVYFQSGLAGIELSGMGRGGKGGEGWKIEQSPGDFDLRDTVVRSLSEPAPHWAGITRYTTEADMLGKDWCMYQLS